MTQHPWLETAPFYHTGGPVGVLLLHGFTGAPTEMRALGDRLVGKGYTVSCPLLPGHGTTVEDLAHRKWMEWTETVETAYAELAKVCQTRIIAGLSLGSLLTLYLAAKLPKSQAPDGVILLSPAIFFADPMIQLSWITKLIPITMSRKSSDSDLVDPDADSRIWCYDAVPGRAVHQVRLFNRQVRKLLPFITVPTLVVLSQKDKSIKYTSGPFLIEKLGSQDKNLITLYNSGHNILCDGERERVYAEVVHFIGRLVETSEKHDH